MKKIFLLLAFLSLPLFVFSQQTEKQYYIYNIITFSGSLKNEGFKVNIDNGQTIRKLRDADGNKINFKTPAAALMYFYNEGWELFVTGGTSSGSSYNGTGSSSTTSYWIIRKPCTKEVFEKTVWEGIKK